MDLKHAPIIGLVGGVGSGKTAIARWLADRYGGVLIDADRIGHQVLKHSDIQEALRQSFGETIFTDGEVDRARLAAIVFGNDSQHETGRLQLESIVYPSMGRVIREQIAAARRDDGVRLILFDAAVLLETGWRDRCDVVAFVDVPRQERVRRVATTRGWSEEALRLREASQWPLQRKRNAADVVIDNSGSVQHAGAQLADYLIEQGWLSSASSEVEAARDSHDMQNTITPSGSR